MANFTITGTLRGEAVTITVSGQGATYDPEYVEADVQARLGDTYGHPLPGSDGAGQAILNAAALALDDYQVHGAPDWWFEVPDGASV
jgi:hypothetical protein